MEGDKHTLNTLSFNTKLIRPACVLASNHQTSFTLHNTGKFYTLTTGANEKRWSKIKDRLQTSVRSFQFLY